jgi:endonuclease YncB( thermonuclease family)
VGPTPTVKITQVVDGDTIETSSKVDSKDTVRLIGIDVPETSPPSCGVQPLAQEATDQLANEESSKVKLDASSCPGIGGKSKWWRALWSGAAFWADPRSGGS